MIIIKILGALDILVGMLFWLFGIFGFVPKNLILTIAFLLLIKGIVFLISKDIASILDVICSLIIFSALSISMPKLVVILVALFLIQKGIFSWFS